MGLEEGRGKEGQTVKRRRAPKKRELGIPTMIYIVMPQQQHNDPQRETKSEIIRDEKEERKGEER